MRVALVTGAGSGIGRAVSLALAGAGFSVVLAGRRAAELERTAEMAGSAKTLAVPTDVGRPDEVRTLFARTNEASAAWICCSTMPASTRLAFRWKT